MAADQEQPERAGAGAAAQVDDRPALPASRSRAAEVWSAVLANRLAVAGLVILVAIALAALLGERIAPYGPTEIDFQARLEGPSARHPFGTDQLGRDILSRVMLGSRISLQVGFISVGIALVGGVVLGLIAGFYGGKRDDVIMRVMDILFAFPAILLAIAVLAILGPGIGNAMIAIGIVYVPIFARVTRASVLSVREEVYVRAARSLGASDVRLLRLHVLPNVLAPIIVQTSISLAFAILSEAALSFLGLGAPRPTPAWGLMLAEGRGFIQQAWWMAFFPGMAILLTVLAFNVLGDALRDALDPRQKSAIESRGVTA
ncbi:MAG TPA: ABC transporter permease [Egibacteraceae bacterium]|nr:ABC transporter permease [Egibacteraceae bacterium]